MQREILNREKEKRNFNPPSPGVEPLKSRLRDWHATTEPLWYQHITSWKTYKYTYRKRDISVVTRRVLWLVYPHGSFIHFGLSQWLFSGDVAWSFCSGLLLHIGITSLQLLPLERIVQKKWVWVRVWVFKCSPRVKKKCFFFRQSGAKSIIDSFSTFSISFAVSQLLYRLFSPICDWTEG